MTQTPTETNNNDDVSSSWGTWEELLLAFAVNRYGSGAWDSIAEELRKRSSVSLTAHNCKLKYSEIRRKYVSSPATGEDDDERSNGDDSVSLLEELRKLRVAELRREVERYDLNIESLETKMKKMEEEKKTESDLEKDEKKTEPGSEKDQVSVNESNSTDLGVEKVGTGENDKEPGREVDEPVELVSEPGKKEESCNGSSNSLEKREALVESEAESKEAAREEVGKDNSDVLSSASRSIEEEGKEEVRRGKTSGDGHDENEDNQSGVKEELSVESQRMMEVLMAIRARKLGFERRLKSQESSKYQSLILEHVDLETIETRLKEGCYKGSQTKFFRDLLLLVNNALVFFNKNSSEAKAAIEVRQLISKEMPQKSTKSDSSSGKQASLQSLSKPRKDESLLKPAIPGPIIVCRKRSSITAKASNSSDKKKESQPPLPTKKGKDATKSQNSSNSDDEPPKVAKRRTGGRISPVPVPAKRGGRTQSKNKSPAETGKQVVKGGSSSQSDAKKNQSTVDSKKRGASNFLNRLNKSSSSNNGLLAEEVKNMPLTSESSKRGEKREPAATTRRSTETRQGKEKVSPEKKNVGRPPKRGAAAPPPPPALGKRGRDRDEAADSGGTKQPRKRSRKLS